MRVRRFFGEAVDKFRDATSELVTGAYDIADGVKGGSLDAGDVLKKTAGHCAAAATNIFSPSRFISLAIEKTDSSLIAPIQALMSLLYNHCDPEVTKDDIDIALWVLISLQKFAPTRKPDLQPYFAKDSQQFKNFHHYLKHASAIYLTCIANFFTTGEFSSSTKRKIAEQTGLDATDIHIVAGHKRPEGIPDHYMCVDRERKEVVLVVRGTRSAQDVLIDLDCKYSQLAGSPYKYHGGILKAAQALRDHLKSDIKDELERNPGYRLVTCGHSLGAGVAALVAVILSEETEDGRFVTSEEIVEGREIHCYAISPPAMMCADAAQNYGPLISSLVHKNDIVPSLSYGTFLDLKAYALYLKKNREYLGNVLLNLGKMMGKLGDSNTANRYLDAYRLVATSEKLVPPGTVFLIEKSRFGTIAQVTTHFCEARFILGMVIDHLPEVIQKIMDKFE